MNIFLIILLNILAAFISFAVGRLTDKWGGHYPTPHHWIYGLVAMVVGFFYLPNFWAILALSAGAAHFISDLKDFLDFKVWSRDKKNKPWRFWSIK